MRTDPRVLQTWNQISQNLESANESAQATLFSFSQRFLDPCLSSVGACFRSATAPCCLTREERLRRNRGRTTGRAEYSFDFYDDWENDDFAGDSLLGWGGNGELDRLLAGSSTRTAAAAHEPARPRAMSYGARRDRLPASRRKPGSKPLDASNDPTIIPSSSLFGFFGRLPWKVGERVLRYQPSAADLPERSVAGRDDGAAVEEQERLLESDEEGTADDGDAGKAERRRPRRDTNSGDSVSDSIRSRADLFPSEDEADAVPLDDEFAIGLERRPTGGSGTESQERERGRESSRGGAPSDTTYSSSEKKKRKRRSSTSTGAFVDAVATTAQINPGVRDAHTLSFDDLKREEDEVQKLEEGEVERKRAAANQLALQRGLSVDEGSGDPSAVSSPTTTAVSAPNVVVGGGAAFGVEQRTLSPEPEAPGARSTADTLEHRNPSPPPTLSSSPTAALELSDAPGKTVDVGTSALPSQPSADRGITSQSDDDDSNVDELAQPSIEPPARPSDRADTHRPSSPSPSSSPPSAISFPQTSQTDAAFERASSPSQAPSPAPPATLSSSSPAPPAPAPRSPPSSPSSPSSSPHLLPSDPPTDPPTDPPSDPPPTDPPSDPPAEFLRKNP